MAREYKHITPEEAEFFMENGYLIVKEAFSRAQAAEFTKDLWVRLGLDPADASTWDRERVHMPSHRREPVATFAPRVWEIMKELLGGEDRIDASSSAWGDSFIVNFGAPPGTPSAFGAASPTPAALANWHVDGDFFVHFLDSPEQALLVIPLFSDIAPGGGATYIAPDALPAVARYLAAHPEGVVAQRGAFFPDASPALDPRADPDYYVHAAAVAAHATRFVELTGAVGDVVLMHPLMPHSASPNLLARSGAAPPRVITNPPVALRAPFEFAREDPAEHSLVELATLRALGVPQLTFAPAAPRRTVVPARIAVQAQLLADERRRLDAAARRTPASAEVAAAQALAVA